MKVALVYDRVNKIGGAEKILLALHKIWPQAPLFTAFCNLTRAPWAKEFKIITPRLSRLSLIGRNHEFFPWLAPFIFESFNFADYDVVISITSAEAKGIITSPGTLHICYCLTPTRYLWSGIKTYLDNPGFGKFNFFIRIILRLLNRQLRLSDQIASTRPDQYVAISKTVQARILKYYQQQSTVIYPPVGINRFKIDDLSVDKAGLRFKKNKEKYFLVVSRLVPYKRIDLIVKTFNELGWNLKVIGIGNQMAYLEKIAKDNIEFLGQTNEEELVHYYQNCQALVIGAEEDFGITALEAQAAGKPVIALGKGGSEETIINKKTGLFFQKPEVKDLKLALLRFKKLKFKASACQNQALKFSESIFIKNFKNFVEEQWKKHREIKK